MFNITFLILHYKNIDETIKCIESIISISENNSNSYNIVVVDNGSCNQTGEKLSKMYEEYSNIKILISKSNLGFSAGNNLGYEYIRKNINSKYIVVTNNDVLFFQKDFIERIDKIYQETNFFVLGPDIYVRLNKEHQSPISIGEISSEDIEKELEIYKFYKERPHLYAKKRKLQIAKNRLISNSRIFSYLYNSLLRKPIINRKKRYEDVVIQGACIIVSNDYILLEEKMFTPEPFLYCEELFLYFKCLKKHYKIIYDPNIRIFHEDSASIKSISKNSLDKAKFTLQYHVSSREMLLSYLKK